MGTALAFSGAAGCATTAPGGRAAGASSTPGGKEGCPCRQQQAAGGGAAHGGVHGGCQHGGGSTHAGGGKHGGRMHGGGGMHDAEHDADRTLFHFLLDHRTAIRREVNMLPDGVETTTESDDPAVAQRIRDHVQSMRRRMEERRPIHQRDPLFAAIFASADQITMEVTPTPKGVRVIERSSSPRVVRLIQAHADVVSLFLERGHAEMRRDHPVPDQ